MRTVGLCFSQVRRSGSLESMGVVDRRIGPQLYTFGGIFIGRSIEGSEGQMCGTSFTHGVKLPSVSWMP